MKKKLKSTQKVGRQNILLVVGVLVLSLVLTLIANFKYSLNLFPKAAEDKGAFDVIVAGAGTGGIGAAIEAAKTGVSVLLIEETDWIGGQMTAAAVTSTDGDTKYSSLFTDFRNQVTAYYQQKGKSVGTCYWNASSFCFEPSVGQRILRQMIAKYPNIMLKENSEVVRVNKTGDLITSLVVSTNGQQKMYTAKVVIDATEYGDLLPLSDVPYRSANKTNTNLDDNACIQHITYVGVMKKYPNGVPNELQIKSPPPGYSPAIEAGFAEYVVKKDGATVNQWPPKASFGWHNAYRGMPDSSNPKNYDAYGLNDISKTGINWANDYPADSKYLTNKTYRDQINCEAKLRTIQFVYYVQNVLGEKSWSVANDEGFKTAYNTSHLCATIPESLKAIESNMPVKPYVRESLRGIGPTTMNSKDVIRSGSPVRGPNTTDSIAIGDYHPDLHGCSEQSTIESDIDTLSHIPKEWTIGPFQIPRGALQVNGVSNLLLAEKNLSQSRIANGATRLQPVTMAVGQAAGALAAESIKSQKPLAAVPTIKVQRILLESKNFLHTFFDINPGTQYFSDISLMGLRGIVGGTPAGIFNPNAPISRETLAVVLSKSFNIPSEKPARSSFVDVPTSSIYFPFIEGLFKSKFTSGCSVSPAKFCPADSVTNAQIAIFALNGYKRLSGQNPPLINPSSPTYSDLPASHWAYKHVETLASLGVTFYCDEGKKQFCPDSPANRGTVMRAVNSVLVKLDR